MSKLLDALVLLFFFGASFCEGALIHTGESGPTYNVDLSQAVTHYATITMEADSTGPETQLMMATWTPGSYLVREYARHVDHISATDAEGKALPLEKISKNRWSVKTGDAKRFKLNYRLYCNEASVRTNSLGVSYAVLVGAATFITIPEQLERAHRVSLALPKGWTESKSAMKPAGDTPNSYSAVNFDELVDSPIVAGNVVTYPFEVAGVKHYLVNINQTEGWDSEKAVADLAKIVAEHHKVWGVVPYDRYYFLNVFSGTGGGLEHDNCCLMMTSKFDVRDEARYKGWLGLCSHEFFHTWNVRRLRPKSLVKYNYEVETYTPSLWIAEGLTSYYEDLLVARAGLLNQEEAVKNLAGQIGGVQRTEGRLVQSLKDSSHDAWIKFYRPAPNTGETQISYYTKGAVVGFLLDMKIRSGSKGTKSLDDVLKLFYSKFATTGYEPQDFRTLCNEAAEEDLTEWFRIAVDSTEELDYQTAADWLGLKIGDFRPANLVDEEKKSAADDSKTDSAKDKSKSAAKAESKVTRWIGIGKPNSPATKAGIADSDEILAINRKRTSSVDADIQKFEVGDPIEILIARNGELQEFLVVVGGKPTAPDWSVAVIKNPTDAQKAQLAAWLNKPLEEKKSEAPPQEKTTDQPK